MAYTPCSKCRRMYRGGANTVFLAVVEDASRWSARLQLCADDARELISVVKEKFEEIDYETPISDEYVPGSLNCRLCSAGLAYRRRGFFTNVYLRGQEEQGYHGQLCVDCSNATIALYGLTADTRTPQPR